MFNFINTAPEGVNSRELTRILDELSKFYELDKISSERKNKLSKIISEYGYLLYPHFKALEELTDSEAVFCLIEKLKYHKTYVNNKIIDYKNPSVLYRKNIKNSSWLYKEGHNIKLICLSALGDGNQKDSAGLFIDWVKCLITLPVGNDEFNILSTTIYLIPFFEREFGCAYIEKSSEVSKNLLDENLFKLFNFDSKKQVKLFITLAQLASHPVVYDILPQVARFSKIVLFKPYLARWIDTKELIENIKNKVELIASQIIQEKLYPEEIVLRAKWLYIENLKGNHKKYNQLEKNIACEIENKVKDYKKELSISMSKKQKQIELTKRVEEIVYDCIKIHPKSEEDILYQDEIVSKLIDEGLWTLSGGSWNSSNVPVFSSMSLGKKYPIFNHFNYLDEDVTKYANLDCQTPYYFYIFDEKKYNNKVIDFFVDYHLNLQKEYNFDGFRFDHIDHVVDNFSIDKNNNPISYRTPAKVLSKLNSALKKQVPYFASIAEYMLWDEYYKEYHKNMGFDVLWGNDIVLQSSKTPKQIIEDNIKLEEYNSSNSKNHFVSILKTYNNQDGEFRDINRYPAQLGLKGALFKWFKLKFILGGMYANRPVMFVDGDESFTKVGIERVIAKEVSMIRNRDINFYQKFNALDMFRKNDFLLNNAQSVLILQDEMGLAVWENIFDREMKNQKEYSYLIVANYLSPNEIKNIQLLNGASIEKNIKGETIRNKTIELPKDKKIISYFDFSLNEDKICIFKEFELSKTIYDEITFKELTPADFRVYKMVKKSFLL